LSFEFRILSVTFDILIVIENSDIKEIIARTDQFIRLVNTTLDFEMRLERDRELIRVSYCYKVVFITTTDNISSSYYHFAYTSTSDLKVRINIYYYVMVSIILNTRLNSEI